jgi:TatA/E family protein of Tat protein translocase
MGGLSWWHWLVIGGAFILLFGAKKLPDAARGIGRSLRILRSEVSAMPEEDVGVGLRSVEGMGAVDLDGAGPGPLGHEPHGRGGDGKVLPDDHGPRGDRLPGGSGGAVGSPGSAARPGRRGWAVSEER